MQPGRDEGGGLPRRLAGALGEDIAACFLCLQGCQILARQARPAAVEVDLVAREGACLVLVEVKLRAAAVQRAWESLGPAQERRLWRAARAVLQGNPWAEAVRVDVIAIDLQRQAGRLELQHLRGVLPR